MDLDEAKCLLSNSENILDKQSIFLLHSFNRNGKKLKLFITDRFRKKSQKGKVWKTRAMLTAIKNAEYGFDACYKKSAGGYDGIFELTRDYKPKNQMMRKIFDQFIDKKNSGIDEIATKFKVSTDELIAVRLVSHHIRLLGVLKKSDEEDILVLVDYDNTK